MLSIIQNKDLKAAFRTSLHKFAQICILAVISEVAGDRIFNITILYVLPVMATCMSKDLSSSLSLQQLGRNRTLAGDPILWLCVNQKNG